MQEEAQQQQSTIEAMGAQIRQLSEGSGGPSFNDQFAALHKKLGKLHRHVWTSTYIYIDIDIDILTEAAVLLSLFPYLRQG